MSVQVTGAAGEEVASLGVGREAAVVTGEIDVGGGDQRREPVVQGGGLQGDRPLLTPGTAETIVDAPVGELAEPVLVSSTAWRRSGSAAAGRKENTVFNQPIENTSSFP